MIQVAFTLALLAGAGLLVQTVRNLAGVRTGYDTENLLTMSITMPDEERFVDYHAQVLSRVCALPGVKGAALGWGVPLTGNKWIEPVEIAGQGKPGDLKNKLALPIRCVTAEYLSLMGFRMAAGRDFLPDDAWHGPTAKTNAPFVAIINQAMADRFFPNANPLGKKLIVYLGSENPAEIVGVVSNARTDTLTGDASPEIYLSFWQLGFGLAVKHLVVKTATDPLSLSALVQRELREIDPRVAIENVKTMRQIRGDSIAPQHFMMKLLTASSLMATALALVGIYGAHSLSVRSRQKEIAIRIAVGARRTDIRRMLLREGFQLVAGGIALGWMLAAVLTHALRALLFGVNAMNPATLIAVALLLTGVALTACWMAAHRTVLTEPMDALRNG